MSPGARRIIFPAIVSAVVVSAIIAAMVMLGPPSDHRQRQMDQVRVRNLNQIESAVDGYHTRHKELPADLDALATEPGYHVQRNDPDSGKSYGYEILNSKSYRLCADFVTDSGKDSPDNYNQYFDVTWAHARGRQCFERRTGKNTE